MKSFSITVRSDCETDQAFDLMLERASHEAKAVVTSNTGIDGEPVLAGYAGIPDLHIVLRKGAVVATFWRNSKLAPCVVVSDLDYASYTDKEQEVIEALSKSLNDRGFNRVPHMESLPEIDE